VARPFSVVRRLTMLVAAVGALSLLLNGWLLVSAIDPIADDLANAMAQQVNSLRLVLQQARPEQREALAATLSQGGLRVYKPGWPPPFDGPPPEPDEPGPLMPRLRALLGPQVAVHMGWAPAAPDGSRPGRAVRLGFDLQGEPWAAELAINNPPLGGPLLHVLAPLALIGLAAALAVVMGVRLITRPLARIAREMGQRQQPLRPIAEDQRAGIELQEIVHAFNDLVQALAQDQETRRHMLAGLSHDLRTPLARLRLRAECECDERTAARMGDDFDALARIIGQFLGYARGASAVSLGSVEPLDELVRHAALRYAEQGVSVVMDDTQAAQLGYPDLGLQRVLNNLVDNALSHGRAPVVIVVEPLADECRITVQDAGRGIPPAALRQALQPFVKLGAEAEGFGHCGLGLAIVQQICVQLGGRIVHLPFDGQRSALGLALPLRPATLRDAV